MNSALRSAQDKQLVSNVGLKTTIRDKLLRKHIKYKWDEGVSVDINLYHVKNGHVHEAYLRRIAKSEGTTLTGQLLFCDDCATGKAARTAKVKISSYTRASIFGGRMYIDLSGPFPVPTKGGHKYIGVIVDDFSGAKFSYLLTRKTALCVMQMLQLFHNEVLLSTKSKLLVLRSDNGKEFYNKDVINLLCNWQVIREYTSDYHHEQNAVVETAIRDIKNLAIVNLNAANLQARHTHLWGEACLYATTMLNNTPTVRNNFQSPNLVNKVSGIPLSMRYQFGSIALVRNERKSLLRDKVIQCLFVGYSKCKPRFSLRFCNIATNECFESTNYHVMDGTMLFSPDKVYFDDVLISDPPHSKGDNVGTSDEELKNDTNNGNSILIGDDMSDSTSALGRVHQSISHTLDTGREDSDVEQEEYADREVSDDDQQGDVDREGVAGEFAASQGGNSVPSNDSDSESSIHFDESHSAEGVNQEAEVVVGSIRDEEPSSRQPEAMEEYIERNFATDPNSARSLRRRNRYGVNHAKDLERSMQTMEKAFHGEVPTTFREAMLSPYRHHWISAIRREKHCLEKNGTWDLVRPPDGVPIVGSRWIFTIKYDEFGNVARFKARLVAQGYTQTEGVDYGETFAPVVSLLTIRSLLALATEMDWDVYQMDVETAFLNSKVEEIIYVKQAPGMEEFGYEDNVYKLNRSLYGLKQSPRNWNNCLTEFLISIGLHQSETDPCMFTYRDEARLVVLCIYVDDIVITGSDSDMVCQVKEKLNKRFICKDLGKARHLLGMIIDRDIVNSTMRIHQGPYIKRMFGQFELTGIRGKCKTPASEDTYLQYVESVFNNDVRNENFDYRSVIGILMHLSNTTRPDITNIVRFLSSFVTSYTDIHISFAKRVIKYLLTYPDVGLHYQKSRKFGVKSYTGKFCGTDFLEMLEAYSDASWADNYANATSTSGYCFRLGSCLVLWKSVKQKVVARSSMESEYVAMSKAIDELTYYKPLLKELLILTNFYMFSSDEEAVKTCTVVFGDNTAAIVVGNRDYDNRRSRHINVNFHNVRNVVKDGEVQLQYISSNANLADFFTKCLGSERFHILRGCFMS